ncbi:MAG: phosphoribosyl-ATP diphosphatase, partial [Mailhella sp.]|nr:phosphoribosyl-ATP diphosphatase [Mailhella sp.]
QDTLLVRAIPDGPTCHKGTDTCWGEETVALQGSPLQNDNPLLFLSELQDFINRRHEEMPEGSYTTSLFKDGVNRMAQKLGEEALEAVIEACNGTSEKSVRFRAGFFCREGCSFPWRQMTQRLASGGADRFCRLGRLSIDERQSVVQSRACLLHVLWLS